MNTKIKFICLSVAFMVVYVSVLHGADFYVSPGGSDANNGSKTKPFATLQKARDAIRKLNADQKAQGASVWIDSGTYTFDRSFDLDSRDSGTSDAPVLYRGQPGKKVSLMGGRKIPASAFKPVTDKQTLGRIDPSVRDKVLQCDLQKLNIKVNGQTSVIENEMVDGAMYSNRKPVPELFFNNKPLPFSRWPNEGFANYGKVIDKGSRPRFAEKPDRPGTFEYTGVRPERWTKAEQILIHGYFAWDWFDDVLTVASLDTKQKHITFTTPHMYGLKPNKRFRALGLLEEIDQPGEWMIDSKTSTLYLYPPKDMAGGSILLSLLKSPIIRMTGAKYVSFQDLTLEVTQGACVQIAGGTGNLIKGCTIRNAGGAGVLINPQNFKVKDPGALHVFPEATGDPLKDGVGNGVVNCELYNIGTTGISIIGGDRKKLVPAKHFAINNDIHHYARRQRANQPAINLNGVGHRAAHNYIHDAPHVGLDYSGNDHVIEYNEIARVCRETGDVGAIYSGRDWSYRGNVVRYNFIHHIKGPGLHGSMAVYLDDSHSSTYIHGNIFYKVQRAAFIGGGRDNIVDNNIFIDSEYAVHIDNRSEDWAHKYQKRGGSHRMYAKLEAVNHDKPPYSERYPKLARMLKENPHRPSGNKVTNNICIRTKWISGLRGRPGFPEFGDNLITQDDPGLADIDKMNFALKDINAIQKKLPEFKQIPFEKIGLTKN